MKECSQGDEERREEFRKRLVNVYDLSELMGISVRMVLTLPIRQIRIGPRTVRWRLSDVYEFLGVDDPNG
jgi:predicted DNA-binding transcriptional regulator AlpA